MLRRFPICNHHHHAKVSHSKRRIHSNAAIIPSTFSKAYNDAQPPYYTHAQQPQTRSFLSLSSNFLSRRNPSSKNIISYFSTKTTLEEERGLQSLLTKEQRTLLTEQKEFIHKVQNLVSQVEDVEKRDCSNPLLQYLIPSSSSSDNDNDDDAKDKEEAALVDSTFAIVIAGEFNAGKSTLINALLGQKLLETGALPTTDEVTIIANDSSSSTQTKTTNISTTRHTPSIANNSNSGIGMVTLHRISTLPLLQDVTFIDTPGTNAVLTNHTSKTVQLLPSADLILFVTSADRPFPDSEKQLLKSIQSYRKNIVVVINKMDILDMSGGNHGEDTKQKVVRFVTENAADLLGVNPIVIPISARDGLACKLITKSSKEEETTLWKRSNFKSLESYLQTTLTTQSKIQSKLLNPIGVAEGMLAECYHHLSTQKKELQIDVATLNLLESTMSGWTTEMMQSVDEYKEDMVGVLKKEGGRCQGLVNRMSYWDQWSWFVLNSSGEKFEREWNVVKSGSGDDVNAAEGKLGAIVRESSDSIATKARTQGQAVIEYLGKRPAITNQSLIGSVTAASRFEDIRNALSSKMMTCIKQDILSNYDPIREDQDMKSSLKQTIVASGCIHVGALTSGVCTGLEVLDLTMGCISTSILMSLGIAIVPYQNKQTVSKMESAWEERSQALVESMDVVHRKEMTRIQRRIMDGVAPYTRYVKTEKERVEGLMRLCDDSQLMAHSLRNRIVKNT